MAATYKAVDETRIVDAKPTYTGAPLVSFEDELVWTHAVAEEDGVLASKAACGWAVVGEAYRDFDTTFTSNRCPKCADRLRLRHLGR